ncbi:MAG: hypothetical protein WBA57_04505 [Elainellaceae cyanobacterium]
MPSDIVNVYVAYARRDSELRNDLISHLSILKRNKVITNWDDSAIEAGEEANLIIEQKFATTQVILLLVSADFLASDDLWEMGVVQAIQKHDAGTARVIPIIVRACDWESAPFEKLTVLPTDGNPVTSWGNPDEAFLDIAKGIRRAVESLRDEPEFQRLQQQIGLEEDVCPYQGLEAFTPETAEFFFGREKTIELIKQKLAEANFVPVIGPSGSGKSSVVRAGLIPSLGDEWHVLEPIKPDEEPLSELRKAMRSLFKRRSDLNRVSELLNTEGLLPVLEMLPRSPVLQAGKQKVLLVIDQFEEVFTVCTLEDERTQFIDCITAIQTVEDSPLAIATTMRADFVEQWLDYGDLVQTIQEQAVWLGRLQGRDLIEAIEQPAKNLGYTFEPVLLDSILEDVKAEKNCLPLLEFALTELWERRDLQTRSLTYQAYRDMQRLTGALNKRAEDVYADDLVTDDERQWAKRICLELLRIGPDVKDTRQRQPRITLLALGKTEDDQAVINEVIEVLVEGRLLVTTQSNEVDLAHEALMMGWLRFAEWRQEDRDRRRLVQRVRDVEKEWNGKGQDERYLLQGGLLAEVREQWETLGDELSQSNQAFYWQSDDQEKEQVAFLERALAESELREQALKVMNLIDFHPHEAAAYAIQNIEESHRRLKGRVIAPVFSVLKKILSTLREAGKFASQWDSVTSLAFSPDGKTIASANTDRVIQLWNLKGDPIGKPFLGHTSSIHSVAFSPDGKMIVSGSADATLRLWNLKGNPIGKPFLGHTASVNTVAFSPDGEAIISGSSDKTLRLWNLAGNVINEPFYGHVAIVQSVAFSPDGNIIVSGSRDKTLRIWDLSGNSVGQPFTGHEDAISSVAFSPDGNTIASGSYDETVRLWDVTGHPIGEPFIGHSSIINAVVFSPDGKTIVSADGDQTIRFWNLRGDLIKKPLKGHSFVISSIAISPDGRQLVSGGVDYTLVAGSVINDSPEPAIWLWDLTDNLIGNPLCGHDYSVMSVAFNPDNQTLVSGSDDGTLKLWDLKGVFISKPFIGHIDSVWSVAFDPKGQTIVSGSQDKTIRLWDLNGNLIGEPFCGHTSHVNSVSFSPNGQTIASGSSDNTIRLWDLMGNTTNKPFEGHTSHVNSVSFSPDGQTIVSGSDDGTVRLWDLKGNTISQPFEGHKSPVWCVVFSPDGQTIASGGDDGAVRLWDLKGNAIGQPFEGHSSVVYAVTFSPDSQVIISGGHDRTVRLWDLQGNIIGEPFIGHNYAVRTLAISPNGEIIASGSSDSTIRLWRGGTWQDWLALCCNRFRYHPVFKNADREPFISACEVCERLVWSREERR